MRVSTSLCLVFVVLLAGCASRVPDSNQAARLYRQAVAELGVPAAHGGAITSAAAYFLSKRAACGNDTALCTLYDHAAADAHYAGLLATLIGTKAGETAPEGFAPAQFESIGVTIGLHHSDWLDRVTRQQGWFTIGRYGTDADFAAFLLLQHSNDIGLQKRLLPTLIRLAESGETKGANAAMLSDRIAIREGQLQTYGTQGACAGPGDWQAFQMRDPQAVDARRSGLGMIALHVYRDFMSQMFCAP